MILLDMYITIIRTPVRNAVTRSNGFLSNKMKEL